MSGRESPPYVACIHDQRSPRTLSDDDLLQRLGDIVRRSRHAEAEIIAHIAEVDARRLHLRQACSSMFAYCARVLRFSEAEAFLRISAARASREHPVLLQMLAEAGTTLGRRVEPGSSGSLATGDAGGLSTEAALRRAASPEPTHRALGDPPPSTGDQLVPERVGTSTTRPQASAPPATIEPMAPDRYKVQFTAGAALRDKLERLQALMRGSETGGDLAAVIEAAVTVKLARLESRHFGKLQPGKQKASPARIEPEPQPPAPARAPATSEPAPIEGEALRVRRLGTPRHIPAAIRRAVYDRDGGSCSFRDETGRRCNNRAQLEYHHRHPYSFGGTDTPEGLSLLCRAHHRLMTETDFGARPWSASRDGVDFGSQPGQAIRP